ncbi:MAG: penicillin-binding protein 2 [Phycisphaerales bacterium]|nr:penicillin-binding protein 2 [Phycisphaerales bacterium]
MQTDAATNAVSSNTTVRSGAAETLPPPESVEIKPRRGKGRTARSLKASAEWRGRADKVGYWLVGGVTLTMAVMLGRVVQLQAAPSDELRPFLSERLTKVPVQAPHGDVYDRRGRVLATTRFAHSVFVDPTRFPVPAGDAIVRLADATGIPAVEIAKRIGPEVDKAHMTSVPDSVDPGAPTFEPKRYLSLGKPLEDWRVDAARALTEGENKIPGVHLEFKPTRVYTSDEVAGHLVGMVGSDHEGLSGAELKFKDQIDPEPGSLQYVRDAFGKPMWVFPGGYQPAERGGDVRLSMDLEIQRIVVEELERGIRDADAAGARCVVLDPMTGEILAMADLVRAPKDAIEYDWNRIIPKGGDGRRYRIIPKDALANVHASLARNRCVEDVYEPGSTFKPFIWATALEHGVVRENETFNVHQGSWVTPYGRAISDVKARDTLKWTEVLVYSSNIGMAQGGARLPFGVTRNSILEFGFGRRPGLGLAGETPGLVTSTKAWSNYTQTSVSIGYEIGVTPVQMVRAFSAFCRTGDLAGTLPVLRMTGAEYDTTREAAPVRVLPPRIAELTRTTMASVTENLDNILEARTGDKHEVFRYSAFGKSGTARAPLGMPPKGKKKPKGSDGYFGGQYNVSFIAGGPTEDPRVVVLVVVDDPGPELVRTKRYYGALVAGPVNRRIMERTLEYLGVTPAHAATGAVASGPHED